MNTYLISFRPGPLGPVVRELTVRAANMVQAFEAVDWKLQQSYPNYKVERIQLVGQAQAPTAVQ